MAEISHKPHVLLFPFPTVGHINPMSLLADHLVASGDVDITLIHTTRTLAFLQQQQKNVSIMEASLSNGIKIEVIEDLLDAVEDKSVPLSPSVVLFIDSIPHLKMKLEELLHRLTKSILEKDRGYHPPCCIISDSFLPWTQDVANKFNIPRIEFWSSSVTVYAMGFHIPQLLDKGYLPVKPGVDQETHIDFIPGLGSWKISDFFYDLTVYPTSSSIFKFLQEAYTRCKEAQRVIVHSVYDWEKDIVHALRDEGIAIDPMGPLFLKGHKRASLLSEDGGCLEWLDKQMSSSVIYASFGSNVKISLEEVHELALGLEDSQQPFLLVIRPDLVLDNTISDALPTDFLSRTKERGRVSTWVPQLDVLSHDAIGGFLTHCGWNSTLESIWNGKPLIGCPRESEQNTNLKCLVDWNVAIPVDVGKNKVNLKKDLVTKAIHKLMYTSEGQRVRKKMLEFKEVARCAMESGHSRSSLNKLVQDIKEMSLGRKPDFL